MYPDTQHSHYFLMDVDEAIVAANAAREMLSTAIETFHKHREAEKAERAKWSWWRRLLEGVSNDGSWKSPWTQWEEDIPLIHLSRDYSLVSQFHRQCLNHSGRKVSISPDLAGLLSPHLKGA